MAAQQVRSTSHFFSSNLDDLPTYLPFPLERSLNSKHPHPSPNPTQAPNRSDDSRDTTRRNDNDERNYAAQTQGDDDGLESLRDNFAEASLQEEDSDEEEAVVVSAEASWNEDDARGEEQEFDEGYGDDYDDYDEAEGYDDDYDDGDSYGGDDGYGEDDFDEF